ncbi:hypothetical protein [Synechococcus sp. CBW1107]|uniref:hypothetical protein n=1 Tax=Synechococcus sp. CBW1107 TaxID=2789857 RepID=UPI002AD1DACB|nr:hypothetical protein [Synechococcus sp. CBW1107]
MHQATAVIVVVIVVLPITLKKGVEAEGEKADHPRHDPEATLESSTHIDQLTHDCSIQRL